MAASGRPYWCLKETCQQPLRAGALCLQPATRQGSQTGQRNCMSPGYRQLHSHCVPSLMVPETLPTFELSGLRGCILYPASEAPETTSFPSSLTAEQGNSFSFPLRTSGLPINSRDPPQFEAGLDTSSHSTREGPVRSVHLGNALCSPDLHPSEGQEPLASDWSSPMAGVCQTREDVR